MEIKDKLIFLRYCAPTVEDLVKRKIIDREYANEILESVSKGVVLKGAENQFNLAYLCCEYIAKRVRKKEIDGEIIRIYFINFHNKLVEKVHRPLCPKEECKIKIHKSPKNLKTDFFTKIDKEIIISHRGYVVDLLTEDELEGILSKSSCLETY